MHENRETSSSTDSDNKVSPAGKGNSHNAGMHDGEESDRAVLCAEQHIAHEG